MIYINKSKSKKKEDKYEIENNRLLASKVKYGYQMIRVNVFGL